MRLVLVDTAADLSINQSRNVAAVGREMKIQLREEANAACPTEGRYTTG